MKLIKGQLHVALILMVASSSCSCNGTRQAARLQSADEVPVQAAAPQVEAPKPYVDLIPRSLVRIPVGTVIGATAPAGWSHLVVICTPTLVPEDERDAPKTATYYAKMFKFTLLANVLRDPNGGKAPYFLDKLARGFAATIDGKETIISGTNTMGAKMGIFGPKILRVNEEILDNEVKQVVRTRTMLLFDAQSTMLVQGEHVPRIMRHAILVDPATGELYTLVWLLNTDYSAAEDVMQLMPKNYQEKRMLSVDRKKFTLGTIPDRDAFALRQVPPGTPVTLTPQLKQIATIKTFDEAQVPAIENMLRATAIQAAAGR